MDLQAIKEKVEGLKEEKTRTEERLKSLNEKKEEILGELKEYGVENIKDIDGKVKGLKKELNNALKDFEGIETEEEEDEEIDDDFGALAKEIGDEVRKEEKKEKKENKDFLEDLDL